MTDLQQTAPEQQAELVCPSCKGAVLYECVFCSSNNYPPAAQPERVSCRFCHDKKGCWTWQCYSCGEIDDVQKPALPAAQRPWVGLTEEEIKEIIGPWGDTPVKGYTRKLFDQIENALRSKNT